MTTFDEYLKRRLSQNDQLAVRERGRQLHERAMTLQTLRQKVGISQSELARTLGVQQPRISKMEKTALDQVAALAEYIAALGGQLELNVRIKGAVYRLEAAECLEEIEDLMDAASSDALPSILVEARMEAANSNHRWQEDTMPPLSHYHPEAAACG